MALREIAECFGVSPELALGLGAGLYFQYFRRPEPAPSHWIDGLNPNIVQGLAGQLENYAISPDSAVRNALTANALWFNLDRAPTTGLLGMEMLAEELPHFNSIADWRICIQVMTETIDNTESLHRRTIVRFLNGVAVHFAPAQILAREMSSIADSWDTFSANLRDTPIGNSASNLETFSRQIRRIAFREEHFWGVVLESVKG